MPTIATRPTHTDIQHPVRESPAGGPICGLCPDSQAATELAYGCEFCDEPISGYCAETDTDTDQWLCRDCGRYAQLA